MSRGRIDERFRERNEDADAPTLEGIPGFKHDHGNWKRQLERNQPSSPKTVGRLVVGSEDFVRAITESRSTTSVTTSGGLLVMSYLRGVNYYSLGNGSTEGLFRRLVTLGTASHEVGATVKGLFDIPVLNKYSKTTGRTVVADLDAPALAPEIERFNRIRPEIPESPYALDSSLPLFLNKGQSGIRSLLDIADQTLPAELTLGPLAVLSLDTPRRLIDPTKPQ